MYIGNDTGTQHVAAAFKKPVVVLSRDSKDLTRALNYDCEHIIFRAWKTKSIVLLPEHSLDRCAALKNTCWAHKPHCITQIEPAEIVKAYDNIIFALKHSGIKKVSCPQILNGTDKVTPLHYGFEFDKI